MGRGERDLAQGRDGGAETKERIPEPGFSVPFLQRAEWSQTHSPGL